MLACVGLPVWGMSWYLTEGRHQYSGGLSKQNDALGLLSMDGRERGHDSQTHIPRNSHMVADAPTDSGKRPPSSYVFCFVCPGLDQGSQMLPDAPRCQTSRSFQMLPEARSSKRLPDAPRSSLMLLGASWSSQMLQEAPRSSQMLPDAPTESKKLTHLFLLNLCVSRP